MKDILRFACIAAAFGILVWFMDIENKQDILIGGIGGIAAAFLVFFIIRKIRKKS